MTPKRSLLDVTETEPEGGMVVPLRPMQPVVRLVYSCEEGVCDRRVTLESAVAIGRNIQGERGIDLPTDGRASRVHTKVEMQDGSAILIDCESRNGTFVNRRPVKQATLSDGDVIRIGASLLLFRLEPEYGEDALQHGPGLADRLLGISPAIVRLRDQIGRIANRRETVLLQGETGTGKELAAAALHARSGLPGKLVTCNLGGLTPSLAESTFFGHEKNAFTGAQRQLGLFREAHRGTLFLDEVGELPIALQPLLLRVLEESVIRPIGGQPESVSVRVVAATNRNLHALPGEQFRADLRARLSAIPLMLPPLRDRREDILLLLEHLLGRKLLLVPRHAEALLCFDWPENVRQLANVARQINAFCGASGLVDLSVLPDFLPGGPLAALILSDEPRSFLPPSDPSTVHSRGPRQKGLRVELTKELAAKLWREHRTVAGMAKFVGMSRRQLTRWLDTWNIRKDPG